MLHVSHQAGPAPPTPCIAMLRTAAASPVEIRLRYHITPSMACAPNRLVALAIHHASQYIEGRS